MKCGCSQALDSGASNFLQMQVWNPSEISVKVLCREVFFGCCGTAGMNLFLLAILCRLLGNP